MTSDSMPYEAIIKECPNLYRIINTFECGEGWAELISYLSHSLEQLITEMNVPTDERPAAIQIKEKFGSLRFYMTTETDEMSRLIEQAEGASHFICENCGRAGTINKINGWLQCLCKECLKNRGV